MPQGLNLSEIADTVLTRDAAEVSKLAGAALGNGKHLQRVYENLDAADTKDDQELRQLYQLVDKMRVTAKDATNLVDRAFTLSQAFLPQIESVYPCAGAAKARGLAHSLHLSIGQAKEVMGNPPPVKVDDAGPSDNSPLGSGASDLLSAMERKIGTLQGMHPGGLVPMPGLEMACMPVDPATLLVGLMPLQQPRAMKKPAPGSEDEEGPVEKGGSRVPALASFL